MKKYTQRELINEAFRDKLKGMASVVGKGVLGAAKNVAKYISPEVYGLAKSAKGIYDDEQSYKAIESYIASNRVVYVYDKKVPPEDIILDKKRGSLGRGSHKTKPYRLSDPDSFKLKERRGEITITYFNATNYATKSKEWFVAYIFRDKDGKYGVFALQSFANPTAPTPDSSGTGSSSAGTPAITGNATNLPTATLATGTNTGSSGAGTP